MSGPNSGRMALVKRKSNGLVSESFRSRGDGVQWHRHSCLCAFPPEQLPMAQGSLGNGLRRTLDFHPGFCDPGAWATAYRNYWSGATFARFPSSLEASHFYSRFATPRRGHLSLEWCSVHDGTTMGALEDPNHNRLFDFPRTALLRHHIEHTR